MKKYFAIIGLIFGLGLITACSTDTDELDIYATIEGIVADSETGNPINNATLTLSPGGLTTTTGNDGCFLFQRIDEGQYTIMVQKAGYETNRKTIVVLAGESIKTDIPMTRNAN